MFVYRWIGCSCDYEKCLAKISVKVHGNMVCVDFVDTSGYSGEVFLTPEKAKMLVEDLEKAIEYLKQRK
jgi:hypothetical protein